MIILVIMVMEINMITEVNAVNFRQNLGEMLNQVQYRNDSIVINKDGKPVAALVDAELFARIRRMRDRFDALTQRIAEAYAGVPLEEGLAMERRLARRLENFKLEKRAPAAISTPKRTRRPGGNAVP